MQRKSPYPFDDGYRPFNRLRLLRVSMQTEAAVPVLHNDAVPFYARLDLPIGAVLTDHGREFCGTVERFNGTVLEVLPAHDAQPVLQSVEALQADHDAWLDHYNHERPHVGYRTQGRRPWETVERFVSQSSARQGG